MENAILNLESEEVQTCPECGSNQIVFDSARGDRICNICGLVIGENIIDAGPEWRAFT